MEKIYSRNTVLSASKEALMGNAYPMINGALMQLYLASLGASTSQIGTFSSTVSLVTLVITLVFSNLAEKKANPLGFCQHLTLLQALLSILMMTAALFFKQNVLIPVIAISLVQTALQACIGILIYKTPYQILPVSHYGRCVTLTGAISGFSGIATSSLSSFLVATGHNGSGYIMAMGVSALLLGLSFFLGTRLTIINHDFETESRSSMDFRQVMKILRSPAFVDFLAPNLLRGITLGVTNSIAMIALTMGLTESEASMIPIMLALAAVATSIIYTFMEKRYKLPVIGLFGAVLLFAMLFLPRGNSTLFLVLFFVGYTGRKLIDDVIPILLLHVIDPAIAGTYHAWRSTLLNLTSTATVYAVGVLLEYVDPFWLLVPAVFVYLICMIWYTVLFNRFKRSGRESY